MQGSLLVVLVSVLFFREVRVLTLGNLTAPRVLGRCLTQFRRIHRKRRRLPLEVASAPGGTCGRGGVLRAHQRLELVMAVSAHEVEQRHGDKDKGSDRDPIGTRSRSGLPPGLTPDAGLQQVDLYDIS